MAAPFNVGGFFFFVFIVAVAAAAPMRADRFSSGGRFHFRVLIRDVGLRHRFSVLSGLRHPPLLSSTREALRRGGELVAFAAALR